MMMTILMMIMIMDAGGIKHTGDENDDHNDDDEY